LPALGDINTLVPTAHFILADAPTHHEQQVREVARAVLPQLLAHVDVGGPESLTNWIRQLPVVVQGQPSSANSTSLTGEQIILPHLVIMKLLPQIAPDDFLALSQRIRQRLYANLRYNFLPRLSEQYALVVLDMIYRTADVEALSVVQDLVDGSGRYMSPYVSPYPQVREAARASAVRLQEQIEKEKVSKTLLRGASAPDAAPETLLRAVSGNTATDPQLLLRANVQQSMGDEKTYEPVSSVQQPDDYAVQTTQVRETEQDATVRLSGGQQ
jgi:hypothetical protein